MSGELWVCTDSAVKGADIRRYIGGVFDLKFVDIDGFSEAEAAPALLFALDLRSSSNVAKAKSWLTAKNAQADAIFIVDPKSHLETVQARALGATHIVRRPVEVCLVARHAVAEGPNRRGGELPAAVATGIDGLQSIFASGCSGRRLDMDTIAQAGASIVSNIEENGLRTWMRAVQEHHNRTYQHCLLVTGALVSFGQQLGFSEVDRHRLAFAGMLHDIGKARVPVEILDKPSALTEDEAAVLRMHPEYGLEALQGTDGLSPDMLDVVIHHHEYLDGSGYPHGLSGSEISDFVRIATICDVFGALVERRAYKPAMNGGAAYEVLTAMGPKLDQDLVRAFRFASTLGAPH
jgi:putative nucleotidyltransferase with HDIG domain